MDHKVVTRYDHGLVSIFELGALPATLKGLHLHMNKITAIENIGHLRELEELDLSSNELQSLAGLEGLVKLTVLNVSANRIGPKITGLAGLPSLRRLVLSYNRITSIAGVGDLKGGALEELELEGNCIAGVKQLGVLSDLPNLRCVSFQCSNMARSNPVCAEQGYRLAILRACPGLQLLDGNAISSGRSPTTTGAPQVRVRDGSAAQYLDFVSSLRPATEVPPDLDLSTTSTTPSATSRIDQVLSLRQRAPDDRRRVRRSRSATKRGKSPAPSRAVVSAGVETTPTVVHPVGTQTDHLCLTERGVGTELDVARLEAEWKESVDEARKHREAAKRLAGDLHACEVRLGEEAEGLARCKEQLAAAVAEVHRLQPLPGVVEGLQEANERAQREIDSRIQAMAELQHRLDSEVAERERRTAEGDRLRGERHKLDLQLQALRDELKRRDDEYEAMRGELLQRHTVDTAGWEQQLRRQLDQREEELTSRHKAEIDSLKRRYEGEIARVREEIKVESDGVRHRLEAEAEKQRKKREAAEEQVVDLERSLRAAEERCREARDALHAAEGVHRDALRTHDEKHKESTRRYEKALQKLSVAYTEQQDTVAQLKAKVVSLTASRCTSEQSKERDLEALRSRADFAEQRLHECQLKLEELASGKRRADDERTRLHEMCCGLSEELERVRGEAVRREAELKAARAELDTLAGQQERNAEQTIHQLKGKIQKQQWALEEMEEECKRREDELHERIADMHQRLKAQEEQQRRLESNLKGTIKDIERSAARCREDLEAELDDKEAQLHDAIEEIGRLRGKLNSAYRAEEGLQDEISQKADRIKHMETRMAELTAQLSAISAQHAQQLTAAKQEVEARDESVLQLRRRLRSVVEALQREQTERTAAEQKSALALNAVRQEVEAERALRCQAEEKAQKLESTHSRLQQFLQGA